MAAAIEGSTVTFQGGQIPVPNEIREAMGLKEGDSVEMTYDVERHELRLRPTQPVADRTYGAFKDRLLPMSDKERRQQAMEEIARNAMQEGR